MIINDFFHTSKIKNLSKNQGKNKQKTSKNQPKSKKQPKKAVRITKNQPNQRNNIA